jgi:glycosyltransferase involved in cell wall biosynthesis
MRNINWLTGGQVSVNWAYGNNCKNLIKKLSNTYQNDTDNNIDVYDIVVFFDILLMNRNIINFPKAKKILRLGGIRPLMILENKKVNYQKIVEKADAVISVSDYLLQFIEHPNATVIPNSVDFNIFNTNNYKKPDVFTVGFVGNISNNEQKKWKGYNLLKQACDNLKIPFKQAVRDELEIRNENMKKEFYNNISCLVLPSYSEGCSNSVSEALACGIPTILCNELSNYHTENMVSKESILFCKRDIDNISHHIEMLKNNNDLWTKLHINGPLFVNKNQNINIISDKWKEVLGKV